MFLLFLLLTTSVQADQIWSPDKSYHVDVYANMNYRCRKNKEVVNFVYYNNGTDPLFLNSCAVTYHYSKCPNPMSGDGGGPNDLRCPESKWKMITPEKSLFTSVKSKKACVEKIEKKLEKLKAQGFACEKSAIN